MVVVLRFLGELLFVAVMPLAVLLSLFALPGSVLVLVASVVHSAATGWHRPSWQVLVALGLMAVAAEAADSVLAIWGARRYGASLRSSLVAGLGAMAGAGVAAATAQFIGLPALLAGPVAWLIVNAVVVLLGASAGAFAAVYWWELRQGADAERATRAGWGSVVGRVLAVVCRTAITAAMATVAVVSVL